MDYWNVSRARILQFSQKPTNRQRELRRLPPKRLDDSLIVATILPKRRLVPLASDTSNRCAPSHAAQPTPAVQPPRDDAERVEPVLMGGGAREADFPADFLPPRPAGPQPRDLCVDRLECQRRSKIASAGRSKSTSRLMAGRPPAGGLPASSFIPRVSCRGCR